MTWKEYRNKDTREQEQLDVARALLEDATGDTMLWLQADPSAEERTHVLAMEGRLADLARIIERRMERRKEPRDDWQWSEGVRGVLSRLLKAREARGGVVGGSWDRLAKGLPRELPGSQLATKPKPKLPEPVKTVNTGFTSISLTKAPAPPREVGGRGDTGYEPKPTEVPHEPPMYFLSDLWPQTNVILLKAQRRFPLQTQTVELCKHIVSEMTPLFVEAVKAGKMKAANVLREHGGGMEDLLRLLLIRNDPGPRSGWGISDAAYRLGQEVRKSDEWLSLGEAIAEAQQRSANQTKLASSSASKVQSTGIIPGQFAGIPQWQLTELMQRRVEAAGRLRTDENQTAHSPDPILNAFNRSDTGVASESTPVQNNGETAQSTDRKPTNRRALVDAYIEEVFRVKHKRITRKDIWTTAGYRTRTEFERWERQDPRHPNKAADDAFTRVLRREKPHLK